MPAAAGAGWCASPQPQADHRAGHHRGDDRPGLYRHRLRRWRHPGAARRQDGELQGLEAVIDKDLASSLLARDLRRGAVRGFHRGGKGRHQFRPAGPALARPHHALRSAALRRRGPLSQGQHGPEDRGGDRPSSKAAAAAPSSPIRPISAARLSGATGTHIVP